MLTVLVRGAIFRKLQTPFARLASLNAPVHALQKIFCGYGGAPFASRKMPRRQAVDIFLDLFVSGQKLVRRRVFQLESGPQCIGGDQADDETLRALWIGMPSREFDALRRRIEDRD